MSKSFHFMHYVCVYDVYKVCLLKSKRVNDMISEYSE